MCISIVTVFQESISQDGLFFYLRPHNHHILPLTPGKIFYNFISSMIKASHFYISILLMHSEFMHYGFSDPFSRQAHINYKSFLRHIVLVVKTGADNKRHYLCF